MDPKEQSEFGYNKRDPSPPPPPAQNWLLKRTEKAKEKRRAETVCQNQPMMLHTRLKPTKTSDFD